jgi:hypothetical protein
MSNLDLYLSISFLPSTALQQFKRYRFAVLLLLDVCLREIENYVFELAHLILEGCVERAAQDTVLKHFRCLTRGIVWIMMPHNSTRIIDIIHNTSQRV